MATLNNTDTIQLGQRVSSSLYNRGPGIVVAIHGEQSPSSIRSALGGAIVSGGRAHFDVAFECGSFARMLPECIIRGVQWTIYEDLADADEIIAAVQFCKAHEARQKEIEEAHQERRAEERTRYAAEYSHLIKACDRKDWSPGRLAAENIRRELKAEFPKTAFRVTSDYNSVDVYWTNGPTSDAVKKITGKYEAGHFDGMTDSYTYDQDSTFADVFGSPEYVFEHRSYTVVGLRCALVKHGYSADEIADDYDKQPHSYDEQTRHLRLFGETDLTDLPEPPKAPKAKGQFWTAKGYLAKDANGWTREFRKRELAEKEIEKLAKLGIKAEIVGLARSWSANSLYIRRVD